MCIRDRLKWGSYQEIAECFSKDHLIEIILKDATKHLKEREFDVSKIPLKGFKA